jgi:hypothetical protein
MAFPTPSVKKLTNTNNTTYRPLTELQKLGYFVFKIRTKIHLRPQIKYVSAVPIFMEFRIT